MTDFSSFAFIFDMDGTLVDNMKFHTDAWQQVMAENGVEMDANEFLIRTAGMINRQIVPMIFPDISEINAEAISERKENLYRELFIAHREPVKGAVEFLTASKELGIKLSVATAAPNGNVEFILDGLDLRHFFSAITTAADITHGKPDPEIFLKSAEKLDVEPRHCMVFEDAIGGIEAARRAGMKAIGITTVNAADELLKLDAVVDAEPDFTRLDPKLLIEKFLLEKETAKEAKNE
jgi:beta-phosphoglucomutase family hydrolase